MACFTHETVPASFSPMPSSGELVVSNRAHPNVTGRYWSGGSRGEEAARDRKANTKYTRFSPSWLQGEDELDRSTNCNKNYDLQFGSVTQSYLLSHLQCCHKHLFYCAHYQKHQASPPETLSYLAIHSHPILLFPHTLFCTGSSSSLAEVSVSVCDTTWQGKADISL